MGFFAFLPMTVSVTTSAPSSMGSMSSCAPRIRISSNPGTGIRVPMAPPTVDPFTDISWMRSIYLTEGSVLAKAGS